MAVAGSVGGGGVVYLNDGSDGGFGLSGGCSFGFGLGLGFRRGRGRVGRGGVARGFGGGLVDGLGEFTLGFGLGFVDGFRGIVGVEERHGDGRHTDGFTIPSAGEDDIFHTAAAEALGRLFAEDPADGVGQVGLAAAVGADDGSDAGAVEPHLGAVDEGFESLDFYSSQFEQSTAPVPVKVSRGARAMLIVPGGDVKESNHRILWSFCG